MPRTWWIQPGKKPTTVQPSPPHPTPPAEPAELRHNNPPNPPTWAPESPGPTTPNACSPRRSPETPGAAEQYLPGMNHVAVHGALVNYRRVRPHVPMVGVVRQAHLSPGLRLEQVVNGPLHGVSGGGLPRARKALQSGHFRAIH